MIYGKPYRQLQREMTAFEFQELKVADGLGLLPHPWLQTAKLCEVLAAVFGNGKRSPPAEMFMPGYRKEAKAMTRQQEIASKNALISAMRQLPSGEPDFPLS